VWTSNPNGSGQLQENNRTSQNPAWSPGGGIIAYETDPTDTFYAVDLINGTDFLLYDAPSDIREPAFSPDGMFLAFRMDGDIHRVTFDPKTSQFDDATRIALTCTPSGVEAEPAWSPDGQSILFSSDRDGDREIYRMAATGECGGDPAIRLTDDPGLDCCPDLLPASVPSPTLTETPTAVPTSTPTETPTSPTQTPTATPTRAPSPTPSATLVPTATPTPTSTTSDQPPAFTSAHSLLDGITLSFEVPSTVRVDRLVLEKDTEPFPSVVPVLPIWAAAPSAFVALLLLRRRKRVCAGALILCLAGASLVYGRTAIELAPGTRSYTDADVLPGMTYYYRLNLNDGARLSEPVAVTYYGPATVPGTTKVIDPSQLDLALPA
jgi:hypothetical protein